MSNKTLLAELDDAFGEEDPLADMFEEPTQPRVMGQKLDALESMIRFIKERGYWVHKCHDVDHHIYPRGCYRIEYRDEIIRYADVDQLIEMNAARERGFMAEVFDQIAGTGCVGPVRVGKPPIDAKGNPIIEANNGNHGPLKAECEYIENTQKVFVQYMGKDENWPHGCWAVETDDPEPSYYDADQIKYIAYDLLGMRKPRPKKDRGAATEALFEATDGLNRKTQTALAKVGINALIDEATGYENEREPDELANMLDEFLNEDDPLGLEEVFDESEDTQDEFDLAFL